MSSASPSDPHLVQQCRERWAELGFTTGLIATNGGELHVVNGGDGPPLLLLHGYPQSGEIWRALAPCLAQHRRLIIPDLPGMGLSGIGKRDYSLPSIAHDIHELVGTLGESRIDVIGHDWGGAVGAVYALTHAVEVRRLVVIESALAGAGFEDLWTFSQPNPAMTFIPLLLSADLSAGLITGREELFMRHLWNTFTANKDRVPFTAWEPYVAAMKRPGLIDSSAMYYRAAYAAVPALRQMIAAGKLTIPVLSIAGAASFGAAQQALVSAFADNIVAHTTVDGAGHFVVEEQPEAVMTHLAAFLELN